MQITSISKFRQNLPKINRELAKNDYVVVIQNSKPTGVYLSWSQWQTIQENDEYTSLLKLSNSYKDDNKNLQDEVLYSVEDTLEFKKKNGQSKI